MANLKIKDVSGADVYLKVNGEGTTADPFSPFHSSLGNGNLSSLPICQFADSTGGGSGIVNMAVDGSTTPVIFKVKPAAGEVFKIARVIISLRDTGSFDAGGWGSNGGVPLANGMEIKALWGSTEIDLAGGSIKSHADLAAISYDISENSWGSGDEFLVCRFTFTKTGQFIVLDGDNGDELLFYIKDDLTHLVDQRVCVQGMHG